MKLTTTNKQTIPIKMLTDFLDPLSSFSRIYVLLNYSNFSIAKIVVKKIERVK